jgi:hypothetical protein
VLLDDFYEMVRRELRDPLAKTQEGEDAQELLKFVKEAADFQTWYTCFAISLWLTMSYTLSVCHAIGLMACVCLRK